MSYRAPFSTARELGERGDGGGTFALRATYRGDRECLRPFVPSAKAAITASPILINRAQGPSTPALWRLTRAPSISNDKASARRSALAIPALRQSLARRSRCAVLNASMTHRAG